MDYKLGTLKSSDLLFFHQYGVCVIKEVQLAEGALSVVRARQE